MFVISSILFYFSQSLQTTKQNFALGKSVLPKSQKLLVGSQFPVDYLVPECLGVLEDMLSSVLLEHVNNAGCMV